MSDLVGNLEDLFSHVVAQIIIILNFHLMQKSISLIPMAKNCTLSHNRNYCKKVKNQI